MAETVLERKPRRAGGKAASDEAAVLTKIAELGVVDHDIADGLHRLVGQIAPDVTARTWYGMPAYQREGKIVFFLQPASKFSTRYATLGFTDAANFDDGTVWPTAFAVTGWDDDVAARVTAVLLSALG